MEEKNQNKKTISSLTDIQEVARYLARIGAEPRSLRKAVVKESAGTYWHEVANISFEKGSEGQWSVIATEGYEPTEAESPAILTALAAVTWPNSISVSRNADLPEALKGVADEKLFRMHDRHGSTSTAERHSITL